MADICSTSIRIDGPQHSWSFDGDDPRIVCLGCGEMRDAISGRVLSVPPTPDNAATARECGNATHHGYGTGYCGDCTKEAGR